VDEPEDNFDHFIKHIGEKTHKISFDRGISTERVKRNLEAAESMKEE
jgi:hypothetical protein